VTEACATHFGLLVVTRFKDEKILLILARNLSGIFPAKTAKDLSSRFANEGFRFPNLRYASLDNFGSMRNTYLS
jgi:hypothetical protein